MKNIKQFINKISNKNFIFKFLKLCLFKYLWKKNNKHNFTVAKNCFSRERVKVGKGTYGELKIMHFGNNNEEIKIGNYCSIAPDVTFLLGGEHNYKYFTTYPISQKLITGENESLTKGPIIVNDDVWIGYGSIILSGVVIGQGAVIAAGSVVYKDIPPYAIYSTGKIIKYRFSKQAIQELCKINYNELDYNDMRNIYEKYKEFDYNLMKETINMVDYINSLNSSNLKIKE